MILVKVFTSRLYHFLGIGATIRMVWVWFATRVSVGFVDLLVY